MTDRIDDLVSVEGKSTVRVRIAAVTLEIARPAADALGLFVGLEVTAALRAGLEAAADRRTAAARVLRHLRSRPRTVREVREYLAQRHGHPEATVNAVVAELEAKGLVDDARYAAWFVAARASRPTGVARLVREMCARGVPRELAVAAAGSANRSEELERALAAARPRFAAAVRLGRERGLRRLAAFLNRRGFRDGVVREATLQLFADVPPEAASVSAPSRWRRRQRSLPTQEET